MSFTLYLKDPAGSRFVGGGLAEAESLLGAPLPPIPPPELEEGRPVYYVRFHPHLRTLLLRFLQGLLQEIGAQPSSGPGRPRSSPDASDPAEYEAALVRVLRSVRANDRRQGLPNLFWLALTRDVAEALRELEAKQPAIRKLKYSLHPLLSSFYRRLEQGARRSAERGDPAGLPPVNGAFENGGLIESLLEDGFAFTELSITDLDFNLFLAANKRYRISADLFFEIYTILVRETERRLRQNDRGLLSRVARHLPELTKQQCQTQAGVVKVMMNTHVMTYLFGDVWQTGAKLTASARLKAEMEHRPPHEVIDVFLDLVAGVKRFEILCQLRDRVSLLRAFHNDKVLEDKESRGVRIYEFGDSAQVLNNALNATVLFLDLRGFTQTSEGQISERDLTRELYAVFDAFVPHVRRFGGTVDKFLGDGMMVTYGTRHADPLTPLNAVRTALLCQETLQIMRQQGKSYFKMGVAIHYGRVYLARFIADDETVQTTVIGRSVNLAGRLVSAAKKALDEDEEGPVVESAPSPEFQVTVDEQGTLFNEGIAVSRAALTQMEAHLPLVHASGAASSMEYFDEQVGRRILIRYAGDAKFKGVRSSFPVYAVEAEAEA
jgi:class 3 adenylate cyclase